MISEIVVPQNRFLDAKLTGLKKKNFIYGKNGTGKSSITEAIFNQYSDSYDIRVFQGFHRIIEENDGLNAISLGKENANLQPKIEKQETEVKKLSDDVSVPEFGEENSYSRLEKANKAYSDLETEVERFYSDSASYIKNAHTDWTGANYDKRKFKQDINSAIVLVDEKTEEYQTIAIQSIIENNRKLPFREPKVDKFLEAVNEIISKDITQSALLTFESNGKMNWAKQGLSLHQDGELCAFCGSKINQSRLNDLNSYFNDEVKALETRIEKATSTITIENNRVKSIISIDRAYFYPEFRDRVDKLNAQIVTSKNDYIDYLEKLLASLQKRKDDIFLSLDVLEMSIPTNFKDLIESYNKLFDENQTYNANLARTKQSAKDRLRLNEVAKKLGSYKHSEKLVKLDNLKSDKVEAQKSFDAQKEKLSTEKEELKSLLSQTVDESLAAANINKLLKALGNQSFTLVQVAADGQSGQYQVRGYDGNPRNIETLSTGEKNIVAFLWFMFDLENPEHKSDKDVVIVFDDPMNSNDDTVQYLIISQIQDLLKNIRDRQILILTHSVHFYLNVRYQWWRDCTKSSYDKTTYHLIKSGTKSKVSFIDKQADDLKTSYDALWSEVKWLYNQHKPDFMLNPIRRIFETYQNFNGIEDMYLEDAEAQKLFNVNSHSIDDLEADLNGKDEVAVMRKVQAIFESVNAREHFKHYWKEGD